MTTTDPSELLARAKRKDHEAFVALIAQYDRDLRNLLFRLCGGTYDLDDLMQTTYLKAYQSLPKQKLVANVGGWLYRIAYNTALDELRKKRPVTVEMSVCMSVGTSVNMAQAESESSVDEQLFVLSALQELPVDQRAAVLLIDAYGFDYATTAQILDVPFGTVASRVSLARKKLRVSFDLQEKS